MCPIQFQCLLVFLDLPNGMFSGKAKIMLHATELKLLQNISFEGHWTLTYLFPLQLLMNSALPSISLLTTES
jgi:hypothetical protein